MKTGFPSIDKLHLQGIPEGKLNPEILPVSILATFLQVNGEHLDEIAIEYGDKKWTKQMVRDSAIRIAGLFLAHGISAGDKIAIALPNCFEGIALTMGANAIGVQIVYLNYELCAKDLLPDLKKHQPKILFTWKIFCTDLPEVDRGKTRIVCLEPQDPLPKVENLDEEEYISFEEFCQKRVDMKVTFDEIQKYSMNERIAIYLQTSGSTSGKPKTLPFTNSAIFASLIFASNSTGTKTRDASVSRVLCIIPYRLPYGWMTLFVNLMGGNTVILAPGATPEAIGEYYKLKPSYIYGTPVIFKTFMEETPRDADLSSVTAFFCSGFSIPEEWYTEGQEYFARHNSHAEIRNNYGIGEGLCIGTASDGVRHKPGTCGKFYVGPEWLIVDDDFKEVKYGEIGELVVSSPSLCHGYFGDSEATKDAFFVFNSKRFYRTGDFVSLAEDGYVTFHGRKKRFYQPKGATDKVNCETIEKALSKSELVNQNAVTIIKDADGFETSKAFVVLNFEYMDVDYAEKTLREFLSESLLDYQMPNKIVFIDEIPMMGSGKVDYIKLQTL